MLMGYMDVAYLLNDHGDSFLMTLHLQECLDLI